jgi:hypothetical protein
MHLGEGPDRFGPGPCCVLALYPALESLAFTLLPAEFSWTTAYLGSTASRGSCQGSGIAPEAIRQGSPGY